MKTKITILLMSSLLWSLATIAQDSQGRNDQAPPPIDQPQEEEGQPDAEVVGQEAGPDSESQPDVEPDSTGQEDTANGDAAGAEEAQAQRPNQPLVYGGSDPSGVDLAADQTDGAADEVMPLVQLEDMPLLDVIRTLARQAKINLQFDPRLTSGVGPDGQPVSQPLVNLRLENVTARQVLEAVLTNHDLVMDPDPKTSIARVTRKDPAAPPPLAVKVFQLRFASPTNLVSLIKPTLSDQVRSQVIPDLRTSQVLVLAVEDDFEAVEKLIQKLDEPTKQVLIEAQLYETAKNPRSIKGIDWTGTLENQQMVFGNGVQVNQTTTTTPGSGSTTFPNGRTVGSSSGSRTTSEHSSVWDPTSGLTGIGLNTSRGFDPNIAFLNADGIRAVLSFLNKDADSEVVATPRAVTLDNQRATLEVTRAFPIFQQSPGSPNTPATTQIIYTNLGTILQVTPRIADTNMISLKVEPEVSNIDSQDRQVINGEENIANIYAIRRVETHVMIPSGNTLVMGGLISDSKTKSYTKVPILGDLPGIGLAFRRESKVRKKSNLIIFITPTIVRDNDFHASRSTFLKTIPRDPEPKDDEETAWDSGKPHDWSKPVPAPQW